MSIDNHNFRKAFQKGLLSYSGINDKRWSGNWEIHTSFNKKYRYMLGQDEGCPSHWYVESHQLDQQKYIWEVIINDQVIPKHSQELFCNQVEASGTLYASNIPFLNIVPCILHLSILSFWTLSLRNL